ncbi:hypothetical protein PFUGPA_01322 [Plasmodium falciparum Palo Alto/Uganda]|uniref:Uncharacterized protein n=3 Tax=Plasmodium falciparum TaxID=5833 RepID=W4J4L4_PLAFP|nr:hypothetical protein PFFVO_02798 [Plasmodium falciparum Vietnam Oak-Knoll (FVO)]ETW56532.1 hypothetical protein PFUGPA_01322 [Plasmodium falciparum Palo Alto/Uganda]ETW61358.1 hypothetical protein PFMC_02778 [Plasmodium falciparum CAMP/Malaysia]
MDQKKKEEKRKVDIFEKYKFLKIKNWSNNKFSVDCSYKHIALLSIILYNLEYIDLLHTP